MPKDEKPKKQKTGKKSPPKLTRAGGMSQRGFADAGLFGNRRPVPTGDQMPKATSSAFAGILRDELGVTPAGAAAGQAAAAQSSESVKEAEKPEDGNIGEGQAPKK